MTESSDYESVQVFIGVDVGKDTHHAVAINRSGKRLFDKALPNDENKLRSLISDLKQHGQILLVVDQPATIGALPVAVARSEGVLVGYLPGLAMRRIADLHAGEAKTDARDAAIIAEAARTLPHALRTLKLADEQIAELSMLCGFDDDLAAQTTQASNRIRGLLTQIHPALERVLGPRLDHPAVLDLLQRYPSPEKLASLGEKKLAAQLCKLAPRLGKRLAADIAQALAEQTVVVPGTNAAAVVLPRLALQLITLRKQRDEVALAVEQRVLAHPLYPVLTSMPGVGVRTAARLLTEVACRAFASVAHLAAYAGLAPVTRRSGSSIRGEHPRDGVIKLSNGRCSCRPSPRSGSALQGLLHPQNESGKRHNQALIALARRRCDVLFAMMRDGTFIPRRRHNMLDNLIGAPRDSATALPSQSPVYLRTARFPIIFTFLPGCYAGEGGALFS
ncbi:IS110 family transposase [Escherichia coli]